MPDYIARRSFPSALVILTSLSVAWPTQGQQLSPLEQRVDALEKRIIELERQRPANQAQAPGASEDATSAPKPQRISQGYGSVYEVVARSCDRKPALSCRIAIKRVEGGHGNGLVVYAQSPSGTSTLSGNGERYPATGVRMANSRQRAAPDKYWKTYDNGEESLIEVQFETGKVDGATAMLDVAVSTPGASQITLVKFAGVPVR